MLLDAHGCDFDLLNDGALLQRLLSEAAVIAGASVLNAYTKQFTPQGVTVAIVLSESHITIHTYPENNSFMADVFTCGDTCQPIKAAEYIIDQLKPTSYKLHTITRG